MITAYVLVAMWTSFVFGGATHAIIQEVKADHKTTVYKVGVDYESGHTHSICEETPLFRGPNE